MPTFSVYFILAIFDSTLKVRYFNLASPLKTILYSPYNCNPEQVNFIPNKFLKIFELTLYN